MFPAMQAYQSKRVNDNCCPACARHYTGFTPDDRCVLLRRQLEKEPPRASTRRRIWIRTGP